jgi:hypothetical protein
MDELTLWDRVAATLQRAKEVQQRAHEVIHEARNLRQRYLGYRYLRSLQERTASGILGSRGPAPRLPG